MNNNLVAGVETPVSLGNDQANSETVTHLANGNYVVTWNAGSPVPGLTSGWYWADVYMQLFDGDGNAIGGTQIVNTATDEDQAASRVIATADGGFIVVWESDHYDPESIPAETFILTSNTINAQRFDAQGNRIAFAAGGSDTGEVTLSSGISGYSPMAIDLSDGSMVISWYSDTDTGSLIETLHFAANGSVLSSGDVSNGFISSFKLTATNDGGYLRTTTQIVPGTGTGLEIFVQKFFADGVAAGAAVQANTFVTGTQTSPATTVLSDGGFVVTWQSRLQDGSLYGIYGQAFNSAGTRVGTEFRVNTYTDNNQAVPEVHTLDDGTFAVTWQSTAQDGSGNGIYLQHYAADGAAIGGEVRIADETIGGQYSAHFAAIDGGIVVAFVTTNADNTRTVIQRTFQAEGTHGGDDYDNLAGTDADENLYGEGGFDVLSGNGGNDHLYGGNGGDWIDGGTGLDTMYGGAGDDIFVVDNVGDKVVEYVGSGWDVVQSSVSYTLGATLESLTLTGTANINGTGNAGDNLIVGNDGNNLINGGAGNDVIIGQLGVDTVQGGDGNDTLNLQDGDTTRDIVDGGDGWDVLVADAYDRVDGGAGVDAATIDFTGYYNATHLGVSVNLANANNGGQVNFVTGGWIVRVESTTLTATGGNDAVSDGNWNGRVAGAAGDDRLLGNAGDDVLMGGDNNDSVDGGDGYDWLFGGAGNDFIRGGAGNDHIGDVVAYTGNVIPTGPATSVQAVDPFVFLAFEDQNDLGADTVAGEAGDDVIFGWGGNDRLDGGVGNDILIGGTGNDSLLGGDGSDTYYVDTAGDVITEAANAGYDQVYSTVSFALSPTQELESLTLLTDDNIDATGNALFNILVGNNGNNVLDGRAGADAMTGMGGNDTYIVDNIGEGVSEWGRSGDAGGDDLVKASVSFQLSDFVERLTLTGTGDLSGTGNALDNTLIGTRGANWLDGGLGADTMTGGLGDDTYIVDNTSDIVVDGAGQGSDTVMSSVSFTAGAQYIETITLTGEANIDITANALANKLNGNGGNNVLDGGAGSDTMAGSVGNDSYFVDSYGDSVVELADSGNDTVYSALRLTLGANVENLVITGSASVAGSGNELANRITGNDGANSLSGLDGNDTIDGGAGADLMAGGLGNDVYYVDNVLDRVVEATGQGTDSVFSSVSFGTGSQYIEAVTLTGSADLSLTGNGMAETLAGNAGGNFISASAGNDTLDGAAGNDTLTGGSGADRFVFGLGSGADVINDFAVTQDTLDLHAYANGVSFGGGITLTQVGSNTVVDLGGGNTITLNNVVATSPYLLSHIVW